MVGAILLGLTTSAHAGPWSAGGAPSTLGQPGNVTAAVGASGDAMVFWKEGTDLIASPFGASGFGARIGVGESTSYPVSVGATDVPYVAWSNDGTVYRAAPPAAPVTVGSGCCVMTPRTPTYGVRAILYFDDVLSRWRLWTETPSGAVTITELGDTGLDPLDVAVAGGRVIVVWTDDLLDTATSRLSASVGAVGDTLPAPVALSTAGRRVDEGVAAIAPSGHGTVAWVETDARVPHPGGGWTVSTSGAGRTAEVAPDGTISPASPIPEAPPFVSSLSIFRDPAGTTTFAFAGSDASNQIGPPFVVERAASGVTGHVALDTWASWRSLGFAAADDGTAVLAWSTFSRGIATSWRSPSGVWSTPQDADASCPGLSVAGLAIGGGRAVLVAANGGDVRASGATLAGPDAGRTCVLPTFGPRPMLTPSGSGTKPTPTLPRRAAPAITAIDKLRPGARSLRVRLRCQVACTARVEVTAVRGSEIARGGVVRKGLRAKRSAIVRIPLRRDVRSMLRQKRARLVLEASAPKPGFSASIRGIELRPIRARR
ncbi:MAG: hypothetical protein ACEQSX_03670 [Baekduiaceae bacterium]